MARVTGGLLVVLAAVMFVATLLVVGLDLSSDLLVVLLVAGVVVVLGAGWWLRERAYVVRLDDDGYQVGLVRGAGVKRSRWVEVDEVAAIRVDDVACLLLTRKDGGTTTIPVDVLRGERDAFAREVAARVEAATRRP